VAKNLHVSCIPEYRFYAEPHWKVLQVILIVIMLSILETCASVIPNLLKIITDSEARSEDNEVATENAISALAKILKYNCSHINVDDVLPHW